MLSPHQIGGGGRPRKPSHYTKHLKIRKRGLRLNVQSSAKKARTNPQPRNRIGTGSVCSLPYRERSIRSRGIHTRRHEKSEYHNTAITFIRNPNHPIRSYCLNPTKLDENVLRLVAPLFVRAMEHLGKLQIDTRKIERSPQYIRPPWTHIHYNRFDYDY
jgi:hypothetical protein